MTSALADAGFHIAHAFDVTAAAAEPGLEGFSPLAGERLGILVGNTRALWSHFTTAMRDPELAGDRDPLQRYTERTISAVFPEARILYGHRRYGGQFLPFQRLAVAIGLGALAPNHLVIHPIYGPWFALRAVILCEGVPPACMPIAQPCQCDARCVDALEAALPTTDWKSWLAVRDACSLRAWRYSEEQLRYHYLNAFDG